MFVEAERDLALSALAAPTGWSGQLHGDGRILGICAGVEAASLAGIKKGLSGDIRLSTPSPVQQWEVALGIAKQGHTHSLFKIRGEKKKKRVKRNLFFSVT